MKKIWKLCLICFLALFVLVSCGNDNTGNAPAEPGTSGNNQVVIETDRKIIYTVSYSLVCENVNETIKKVHEQVISIKGWISESSQSNDDYGYYNYKIPTDHLNEFLDFIDALGGSSSKTIQTEDVTSSYNELTARIEVLEASRQAYLQSLNDESLTLSEIITIKGKIESLDKELKTAYLELDSLKGQLSYSTVTITYHKKGNEAKEYWDTYGSFIVTAGKTLGSILLYTLPFAGAAGIVFGIIMLVRRKNKNKKEDKEE